MFREIKPVKLLKGLKKTKGQKQSRDDKYRVVLVIACIAVFSVCTD